MDHLVDQRVFRGLVDNPYFLGPIVAAFVLGLFSNRVWKTNAGFWVWLFHAVILVWNVFSWKSYTSRSNLADAWANYFGSDCGDPECLYDVLVTAPFYTSVAYSVGWIAMRLLGTVRTAPTAKSPLRSKSSPNRGGGEQTARDCAIVSDRCN